MAAWQTPETNIGQGLKQGRCVLLLSKFENALEARIFNLGTIFFGFFLDLYLNNPEKRIWKRKWMHFQIYANDFF